MAVIYLLLSHCEQLDVPGVVAGLQSQFPGTTITATNSFDAERKRARASMAEIATGPSPLRNPQRILQRITSKEKAMGPGVDVSIPVGVSLFCGHIWAKNIKLSTDAPLSSEEIRLITSFLDSLGVGTVEVVE